MSASPFAALSHRDFRLLWIGVLFSRIGTEMMIVAVNWQIYELTGSALSLGLIGLSRFIPVLFAAPFGGITADRHDRRHVMLGAQIMLVVLAAIMTYITNNNTVTPLSLYILIALQGVVMSFDTPARQSIIPLLVPKKHLMNAVGLNTIMWQSSVLVGPAVGGFIIAVWGAGTVYLLNTISYVAVIIALVLMKRQPQIHAHDATFDLKTIKAGFTFVKNTPLIRSTMLLDFFATFFASATVLLPIFAKDILRVGPAGLGLLYAAPSVGAIVAGLLFTSLKKVPHQGRLVVASICLYGVGTVLFGLSRSFILSLFFLTFIGAGDMISTIIRNTIRQLKTPDTLRGRMVAVNMLFFMGGPQLGEAEAGVLAFLLGAPLSVVCGGALTIFIAILIYQKNPELKKYHGEELAENNATNA